MRTLREKLRHGLLAVLARRRGEVRAMQDLRHLAEIARLTGVFAATMLLPIAFLAFLALNSIRSEELSVDRDLQDRGRATTTQLTGELQGIFDRFEAAVLERIRRGESPTSNLGELSPYLRAAFRFDDDGTLAAPFEIADDTEPPMPPIGWKRAARVARMLETTQPLAAAAAWREARKMSLQPSTIGESILGESRSLAAGGRYKEAEDLLTDLFGDLPTERDERGFRFRDLALLEVSRQRIAQGDVDMSTSNLQDLVDQLLTSTSPWTIGREGEPAVVREALRMLEGRSDPDWLARSRSRLNELQAQLYWAELVKDEIELVFSRTADGDFEYRGARDDSPAVWAIVRSGENTYSFSFSVEALYEHLKAIVIARNALDVDLEAHLYRSDEDLPDSALSARLDPWLPVTLAVAPKDPAGLEARKKYRRTVRAAVVFTAVFVAVVGSLWIARVIAFEVETARQRADFAANVSHELRSPITQIRLKGEALQLGLVEPGDDMQQHFDAIVRESERLSRLVDDVLDFAAIERGAKRYHPRPDDLVEVVATGVAAARSALEQAGMTLEIDLQDDLPRVWIDREAIGQVVTNLLSNALKYATDGKWVRVRLHAVGDIVELSVADRGIGISDDEIARVFDDFFRSTDPKVRRTKGTGIGLAIVRYIVEAHGGTISVESTLGNGARFIVQLPLKDPLAGEGESELMPRILFVEDELAVIDSVKRFFQREGYDVFVARSQTEALDAYQRYPPDCVVLDVMLNEGPEPDRSGFDVCRALRDADYDGPVIFVTARTGEQDKLLGFELGADDYVTKPFSMLELKARISAVLRRTGGAKSVYKFRIPSAQGGEGPEVEVDLDNYVIRHPDGEERLSNREQELLRYLIEHRGKVLPRGELLTGIWRYSPNVTTRTVDTHILNVRKKLRDDAGSPMFIETLHGVGYRFIAQEG